MKKKYLLGSLLVLAVAGSLFFSCDDTVDPEVGTGVYRLTATTSHPAAHMFIQSADTNSWFEITLSGMDPSVPVNLAVEYKVTNYFNEVVDEGSLSFNTGQGASQGKRVAIDKSKPGYFTVTASMPNGPTRITLPSGSGTRPRYWINYAVVPDPATRRMNTPPNPNNPAIQEGVDKSVYFGMDIIPGGGSEVSKDFYDGVFSPVTWLGIDATISGEMQWAGTFWLNNATNMEMLRLYATPGQQVLNEWTGELDEVSSSLKIRTYALQEMLAYMPKEARTPAGRDGSYGGELHDQGKIELVKYLEGLADIYIIQAPFRPRHYFQVLWEPVDHWGAWQPRGDAGGDQAIVDIYKIAYETIHGIYDRRAAGTLTLSNGQTPPADPSWENRPVILGPTYSDAANPQRAIDWHTRLFELGLAKYIDGLSIHPYNDIKHTPAMASRDDGYANIVKGIMDLTKQYYNQRGPENPTYFDRPFFWATEQGLAEGSSTPLIAAQILTRQNLTMLGEGFDSNHNFCFTDYNVDQRYGFFYNCTGMSAPLEVYGARRISPKPAVSTYAAITLLLKGYVTEGRIDSLCGNGTKWGYKYRDTWETNSNAYIYAVWDFAEGVPSQISFTPDVSGTITLYDILGNDITDTIDINGGVLNLTLTENVLYIKVAP